MAGTSTKILIVGPDPKLRGEFEAALGGITKTTVVAHHVADYRLGVEAARNRRPDLALVEMPRDLRVLKNLAEEIAVCSPETALATVYAADYFGPDVAEGPILIDSLRFGVRDFLRRPISSHDLQHLINRLQRHVPTQPSKNGTIVSFISNKGGVGKSTVSLSVACALAKRYPGQVLLIDASLQMGVCATTLDIKPATSITDAVRERNRLDETLLRQLATPHPCGLHLLPAPADAVEAAEVDDETMSRILTLARRAYDYVIVDTFPLFDRVVMAVLDLSERTYVVLESVVPTLVGGAKMIQLLDSLNYHRDRQRVVLNRYSNRFVGNLKPADVAARLGREVDHVVPYEKQVVIAMNMGNPYILHSRWFSRFHRAINRIANEVAELGQMPSTVRETAGPARPPVDGAVNITPAEVTT